MKFKNLFVVIYLVISITVALSSKQTLAQSGDLIQVSGLVYETNTKIPVNSANIFIAGSNRGTVTTSNGFFSLVATPQDTIVITAVGFKRKKFIVPEEISSLRLVIEINLDVDTIMLEEAIIYPWPSKDQFKEAFLSMEVEEDKERAQFERAGFIFLDTIYPVEPSIMNPVSFIYENVIEKINERKPKKKKAAQLPVFK